MRSSKSSPGHSGAGPKGGEPCDGNDEREPGPVDGGTSPARVSDDPEDELAAYLRKLDPAILAPCQRRYLGLPEADAPDPFELLLRNAGREIDEMLDGEDPGYQERVRARLFGGGET